MVQENGGSRSLSYHFLLQNVVEEDDWVNILIFFISLIINEITLTMSEDANWLIFVVPDDSWHWVFKGFYSISETSFINQIIKLAVICDCV